MFQFCNFVRNYVPKFYFWFNHFVRFIKAKSFNQKCRLAERIAEPVFLLMTK